MQQHYTRLRVVLFAAFTLELLGTLTGAFIFFAAPVQQIESTAELKKSQATGKPITNADITHHVSRIGYIGRNFAIVAGLSGMAGVFILVAMIMVSKHETQIEASTKESTITAVIRTNYV